MCMIKDQTFSSMLIPAPICNLRLATVYEMLPEPFVVRQDLLCTYQLGSGAGSKTSLLLLLTVCINMMPVLQTAV